MEQRGRRRAYPHVYVTVISRNEEPAGGRPDYTADPNYYLQNRNLVKLLAETITSRGATCSFQSDWSCLKAVAMYDVASVTNDAAGKNILRWMQEDLVVGGERGTWNRLRSRVSPPCGALQGLANQPCNLVRCTFRTCASPGLSWRFTRWSAIGC